jgi:DNA polymerase III subunit beta
MEFVIQKSDLVRELQTVTGVVEKRTTLPILANLLLEAQAGAIEVGASDLEISIRGKVPAKVKGTGSVTLPANKLHEIARLLPGAEVSFKVLERSQVAISCERTRYKIAGQPRDEFPSFLEVDPKEAIQVPGGVLRRMIARVAFAASMESMDPSLRGALLLVQKGQITVVATDGYRLSYVSQKAAVAPSGGEVRLVVPRKALLELQKLLGEVADGENLSFGTKGNHVFFLVGSHVLTSTVPVLNFPKYDQVMPKAYQTSVTLPTEGLMESVKRVALLASDRFGRVVKFELSPGKLELSSGTEMGEAADELPVEYDGVERKVSFSSQFILDFLSVVDTPSVRMEMEPVAAGDGDVERGKRGTEAPVEFRPALADDMEYRYIVMPRNL